MYTNRFLLVIALIAGALSGPAWAQDKPTSPPADWQQRKLDLRMTGGSRARAVYHPSGRRVATRADQPKPRKPHRQTITPPAVARQNPTYSLNGSTVTALIIDNPPLDGFVPWIAVVATDEKDIEFDAVPSTHVGGTVIHPQPLENDFAIGLYDTGASAHVMGHGDAGTLGLLAANKLTSADITITGVTGSVVAKVSYPIGLYIDGLDAIDVTNPNSPLLDTTGMLGETNVSIAVGQTPAPGQPDLPTVMGSPMSAYWAAVFDNDQQITRTVSNVDYQAPRIRFYDPEDPQIPAYPNLIPLELRPLGAVSVQYIPCVDFFGGCPDEIGDPVTPSIIVGNSSQSLFFLGSVDLYNGSRIAVDKDRFMLDTGAQITVVGYRIGARLGLNPAQPDFMVEIEGVDGQTTFEPGFYITSIQVPALGEWLTFNNVPVALLDVASPEGGTLDGIIGMNLLVNLNFVLRGGGMAGQADPSLEYEVLVPAVTDCDFDNDSDVDMEDFGRFQRCLTGPDTIQNEPACLDARLDADSDVDVDDLAIFRNCFSGPSVPASPECAS